MSGIEQVKNQLFSAEGRRLVDIKFFPVAGAGNNVEHMCDDVHRVVDAVRSGRTTKLDNFGDSELPQVPLSSIVDG